MISKKNLYNHITKHASVDQSITTTTEALERYSDFWLVGYNPDRTAGATGTRQDLNVAISRHIGEF